MVNDNSGDDNMLNIEWDNSKVKLLMNVAGTQDFNKFNRILNTLTQNMFSQAGVSLDSNGSIASNFPNNSWQNGESFSVDSFSIDTINKMQNGQKVNYELAEAVNVEIDPVTMSVSHENANGNFEAYMSKGADSYTKAILNVEYLKDGKMKISLHDENCESIDDRIGLAKIAAQSNLVRNMIARTGINEIEFSCGNDQLSNEDKSFLCQIFSDQLHISIEGKTIVSDSVKVYEENTESLVSAIDGNNIATQENVLGNSSSSGGPTGVDSTAENIDGVNSDVGVDLKQVSYDALNSLIKNSQTFNQYAKGVNTPNPLDPSNTIEGIEDNLKTIFDDKRLEKFNPLKEVERLNNVIKGGTKEITSGFERVVGEHGEELVQKGTIYKGQELPNPASISEFVEGILKGSDNNILVNAVNRLNNIIGKAINDVRTAFSNLSPEAKDLVGSNPEEIEQKTGGLWQGITGWIQEMNDNVNDFFNPKAVEEAKIISDYINNLEENPLNVVKDVRSSLNTLQVVSEVDVENIIPFENNPSLDTTGKTYGINDQNALLNNQNPLGIIEKTQSLEALGFANTNDDLVLGGRT